MTAAAAPPSNRRYWLIALVVIPVVASMLLFCAAVDHLFGCHYERAEPMVSPDGNTVARVVASNCGGAVGSADAYVVLEDRTGYTFLPQRFRSDPVFSMGASGLEHVEVTWRSSTELEVRFREWEWARIHRQQTSWKHVTITYDPVEHLP